MRKVLHKYNLHIKYFKMFRFYNTYLYKETPPLQMNVFFYSHQFFFNTLITFVKNNKYLPSNNYIVIVLTKKDCSINLIVKSYFKQRCTNQIFLRPGFGEKKKPNSSSRIFCYCFVLVCYQNTPMFIIRLVLFLPQIKAIYQTVA